MKFECTAVPWRRFFTACLILCVGTCAVAFAITFAKRNPRPGSVSMFQPRPSDDHRQSTPAHAEARHERQKVLSNAAEPDSGIWVTVRTTAGEPVAKTPVTCRKHVSKVSERVTVITDTSGSAFLGDPPSGTYELMVGCDIARTAYHAKGQVTRVTILMPERRSLTVTVCNEMGLNLEGAEIALRTEYPDDFRVIGKTDAQGRFSLITALSQGELYVAKAGYEPKIRGFAQTQDHIRVILETGEVGGLELLISTFDGGPVTPGLLVIREIGSGADSMGTVIRDLTGKHERIAIPAARYGVQIFCESYAEHSGVVDVSAFGTRYEVALVQGGSIDCTLLSATDIPIEGALVYCGAELESAHRVGTTDENGRCLLKNVRPGNVAVRARHASGESQAAVAVADGSVSGIVLKMPATLSIRGVCQDPTGKRCEGLRLDLQPTVIDISYQRKETTTDKDGEFAFDEVIPANYRLRIRRGDGHLPCRELEVRPGTGRLTLVIDPAETSTASVTGLMEGSGRTMVCLVRDTHDLAPAMMVKTADKDGGFSFNHVPLGDWVLWISRGSEKVHRSLLRLGAPGAYDIGSVSANNTGSIRVQVDTTQNSQLRRSEWKVAITAPDFYRDLKLVGDTWIGSEIAPGSYRVCLVGDAPRIGEAIEVVESQTAAKTLILKKFSRVYVHIRHVTPTTVLQRTYDVRVHEIASGREVDGRIWKIGSGPDAETMFWLVPGAYHIVVNTSDGLRGQGDVFVVEDEASLDITLF